MAVNPNYPGASVTETSTVPHKRHAGDDEPYGEVTAFMAGLCGAGAFAGSSTATAYTVTCDASTTSPTDMLEGIVNVNIAFAPVDPAEFVFVNISINAASAAS